MTTPSIDSVIADLRARGIVLPPGNVVLDSYGDSPGLSASLLDLIRRGHKRAGTSLLWEHEAQSEALPRVGDVAIVLDHINRPALITRITSVDVLPFNQVSAEYAMIEGEGDKSLDDWRKGHWAFFTRVCRQIGREPEQTMPVVCVVFDLLQSLD